MNKMLFPNLEVLAAALQVASDPIARPGMERAILFITPPQGSDVSLGLQSIISSANKQNIHIYVWLLAAPEVFRIARNQPAAQPGRPDAWRFFRFSRDEPVPDLETLLEPLRYIYQLGFSSQVTAPGTHQVIGQVTTSAGMITTSPQSFELNFELPAPTMLDIPGEIVRTFAVQPTPGTAAISADLLPEEQVLNIKVAFPDGYDRPLTLTRLYVDGAVAAENSHHSF